MSPITGIRRFLRAASPDAPRQVDWASAPHTYKRYPAPGRVALPPTTTGTLLTGLLGPRPRWVHPATSNGLPAAGAPAIHLQRPVPSGGALYPIECYLATGSGLYHYDAGHHCLDVIRPSDHRNALRNLLTDPPATPSASLLILSAVFWRTGFKYGDFAYRLQCQETGALIAQAQVLADSLGLTCQPHLSFIDKHINALLGLDPDAEGALAVLTVGHSDGGATEHVPPTLTELLTTPPAQPTNPPASATQSLTALLAFHHASSTTQPRSQVPATHAPAPVAHTAQPLSLPRADPLNLSHGVAARSSAPAGFSPAPISLCMLASVLRHAGARRTAEDGMITLYVVAQRVQGLPPGAYRYDPDQHALTPTGGADTLTTLRRGRLGPNTVNTMDDAAALLIPVGDPLAGTSWASERWYRIQQIHTGAIAHRATLAATILGLAARFHSDITSPTTDAALGLADRPVRSLTCLLVGQPRHGAQL